MQIVDVRPSDEVEEAAWIGPRLHPFEAFDAGSVIPTGFDSYARLDHEQPGLLPQNAAAALIEILPAQGDIWIALWEGYGFLYPEQGIKWLTASSKSEPPSEPPVLPWRTPPYPDRRRRRIKLPHRNYLLYRGPASQIAGWMEGPNLWWPDDRSWCVASEIDLAWTYVGGAESLIARVMAEPKLGAKPLSLDESTLARDHPELGERP
jgi:hypothetical protein